MATTAAMKEKYLRHQAFVWLVAAGAIFVLWFVLWLISGVSTDAQHGPKTQEETQSESLPKRIEFLGELDSVVSPLEFSTLVRDLRTYPAEFKDKGYFDAKSFAVQVMDVSKNEIIVNYLNSRPKDREQFAYFRYLDENENPRYVLTYGKFATADQAAAASRSVDFALPSSVMPHIVSMADYQKIIDTYERGTVQDFSGKQARQIILQPTRFEIPVQPAMPEATEQDKSPKPEIRHDDSDVVVQPSDVKTDEKAVAPKPAKVETAEPKPTQQTEPEPKAAEPTHNNTTPTGNE